MRLTKQDKEVFKQTITILNRLGRKDRCPTDRSTRGICSCVCLLVCKTPQWKAAVRSWPHYSGDTYFPVPCQGEDANTAYFQKHLWQGEYGDSRRSLTRHIAREFKKLL